MDFVDNAGTRYQLTETAEAPAPAKKAPVWPWVIGGLAVAGGLVWMASQTSRKANPIDSEIEALIVEARDPSTDWARLWELVKHPEVEVRRALLDNPNICPTNVEGKLDTRLLEKLAQAFPEEVAAHPLFVLHALIEPAQEMEEVVLNVAGKTKDVGLIDHVLTMWGPSLGIVRVAVAQNPSAPEDVLRTLGNPETESNTYVRRLVALNPNTPGDLLRTLGNPKTESFGNVREGVALNLNAPEGVLRTLGNPKTESDVDVRRAVAGNPSTPEDVLRILGNQNTESDWRVRLVVASNPRTPVDVLRTLANPATESSWVVRRAVAKNPNTPRDILRILGNEKTEFDRRVRTAVAENPNTPVDVLRILGNEATESDVDVREVAQKALVDRGLA